jgi:hypothetical protein
MTKVEAGGHQFGQCKVVRGERFAGFTDGLAKGFF